MCEGMSLAEIVFTAQVFPVILMYGDGYLTHHQRMHCSFWIQTGQHGLTVQHNDYDLWHHGEHFVRQGSPVVGLIYHWEPRTDEDKSENVGFLVLHESAEAGKYRRVGLGNSDFGIKFDTRVVKDIIEEKTIILI